MLYGKSCFVTCSVVCCLNVNVSRLIASVREGGAVLCSAIVYSLFYCFCLKEFPLPLGAWERLCYFIVALSGPSIFPYFAKYYIL